MGRKMIFEDCAELAEEMIFNATEGKTVNAVLYYEDATALLSEIIRGCDEAVIELVDIASPILTDDYYGDEYIVTLDDELRVYAEPAKDQDRYLGFTGDIAYIDELSDADVLKASDCVNNITISIANSLHDSEEYSFVNCYRDENIEDKQDDEEDIDEPEVQINTFKSKDGDVSGFRIKYSSSDEKDTLDKYDSRELLKKLDYAFKIVYKMLEDKIK